MIELVERPKTMPGPPVASITASAGMARTSMVRRSIATLPTQRPDPSFTIPSHSQYSNLLTIPSASKRRTCSSSA